MVKASSVGSVRVVGDGEGVVGHVGLHVLGRFADRLGVTSALSGVFPDNGSVRPVTHDRGGVLSHGMLMLTGGGEACTDLGFLRAQPQLFGPVASASTFYRLMRSIDEPRSAGLAAAMSTVRERVWKRSSVTNRTDEVVLDIDASLHEIHSENKEGAGPHYRKGYGFHPLYVFSDATGECLGHILRPGNAAANTVSDHVEVLDQAIQALPAGVRVGHGRGDSPDLVERTVRVRTDSAGGPTLAGHLTERNIGFSMVCRSSGQIKDAIGRIEKDTERWKPALDQKGKPQKGAQVAELTDLVHDNNSWPKGTRLIVRREPLHPGAQRSLFDSDRHRYWGHRTNSALPADQADLDMRSHARVENHIARLKQSGANRFPFTKQAANRAWLQLVVFADALVRWFQLLCLTGHLTNARPKTMRWWFWHTPARITRHARQTTVHIPRNWPTTPHLLAALQNITAIK